MRRIIAPIYQRLHQEKELVKQYPDLRLKDGKIHVLYVHCLLNGSGLYRMILPHIELNRTQSHSAIIGTMHKWDFNKQFNDYDNPLDPLLISWADIIVLPTMITDATYIQQMMLSINPNLGFVMDVDDLFHPKLETTRVKQQLPPQQMEQFLDNLSKMDLVSCPTSKLIAFYRKQLNKRHPQNEVNFTLIPNLISSEGFQRLGHHQVSNNAKLRIGIVGSPHVAEDAQHIQDAILEVANENPDAVEWVLFGWNGKLAGQPVFGTLPTTVIKPVNVMDYYSKLHSIGLDLALLPNQDNAINKISRTTTKYAELAGLGIPVIAAEGSAYSRLIAHGENGLIAATKEEWKTQLTDLIKNREQYKQMSQYAQKFAWKNLSWNRFKTKILTDQLS